MMTAAVAAISDASTKKCDARKVEASSVFGRTSFPSAFNRTRR